MATPKKLPHERVKTGRPTKYCPEIVDKICKAVSSCTLGLTKLCELNKDFPTKETINEWRSQYPEFSSLYSTAKMKQADLLAEEIQEIADQEDRDPARAKLMMDARKWLSSKLIPKVYGDRVTSETTLTIRHEDALKELE